MATMKRAEYVVLKDFSYPIYWPLSEDLAHYKAGDKVRLRISGKMAKNWLEKGYIEWRHTEKV